MMHETTQEKIERLYKEGFGTWSIMIETGASRKTVNDTIRELTVINLKWYRKSVSRSADIDLGAPYKVMKDDLIRGKYRWSIYATQQGISANVIERCVSVYWPTKRDATLALHKIQDEMAL